MGRSGISRLGVATAGTAVLCLAALAGQRPAAGQEPPAPVPMTVEERLRRLEEASGTQFDPGLVRAFVRAHRSGRISPVAHAH